MLKTHIRKRSATIHNKIQAMLNMIHSIQSKVLMAADHQCTGASLDDYCIEWIADSVIQVFDRKHNTTLMRIAFSLKLQLPTCIA
jgi:hypothetical protein